MGQKTNKVKIMVKGKEKECKKTVKEIIETLKKKSKAAYMSLGKYLNHLLYIIRFTKMKPWTKLLKKKKSTFFGGNFECRINNGKLTLSDLGQDDCDIEKQNIPTGPRGSIDHSFA